MERVLIVLTMLIALAASIIAFMTKMLEYKREKQKSETPATIPENNKAISTPIQRRLFPWPLVLSLFSHLMAFAFFINFIVWSLYGMFGPRRVDPATVGALPDLSAVPLIPFPTSYPAPSAG